MEPETAAFVAALVVNFIDHVGSMFTMPVIVPYGFYMGANLETIATFTTVNALCSFISLLWMPRLSDKVGRKSIIMISFSGSALGYFVQGSSMFAPSGSAVAVFIIGRGLQGFFSATQPVLRAYITEISKHSQDVLKQRLVKMSVTTQVAGIVLQPIAGAVATFGLTIPFFVCGVIGIAGSLWACCFFSEADKVKALSEASKDLLPRSQARDVSVTKANDSEPRASFSVEPSPPEESVIAQEGNPFFDKVVLLICFGSMSLFVLIVAMGLLIPVMLAQPSYGLVGSTEIETQGEIAKALGLLAIPFGVCNILVSLFLYVPVTKKFGEVPVVLVAGTIAAVNFGSYGFLPSNLWDMCILEAIGGCAFGFLIPIIAPIMSRYASTHYSTKIGTCQALPFIAGQISMTFGQNIIAVMYEVWGLQVVWLICAACTMVFALLFCIACVLVERRSPRSGALTSAKANDQLGLPDFDSVLARQITSMSRQMSAVSATSLQKDSAGSSSPSRGASQ